MNSKPSTANEDQSLRNKRAKVISSLRQGKFSDFKNSQSLIENIKRQKDSVTIEKCTRMVEKQQTIVRLLNEENLRLVQENQELRREQLLMHKDHQDLLDQNQNLKQQLSKSQNNCALILHHLKMTKQKLSTYPIN